MEKTNVVTKISWTLNFSLLTKNLNPLPKPKEKIGIKNEIRTTKNAKIPFSSGPKNLDIQIEAKKEIGKTTNLVRILFIESIGFSNNILNLLKSCYSILKKKGKIYMNDNFKGIGISLKENYFNKYKFVKRSGFGIEKILEGIDLC